MYSKPLRLPRALCTVLQRYVCAARMILDTNLNGDPPWVIEIVHRINRTKLTSCASRLTRWTLDSCSSVGNVERVEVAVLSCGCPLASRLQIAKGEVAVQRWVMTARCSWAGQRSPDFAVMPGAAAVYGVVLLAEVVVGQTAVLFRGDDLAVHSTEIASAVYSVPAPGAAVAAEMHDQT